MPPNTVSVARPRPWGNPYEVAVYGRDLAILLFAHTVRGRWSPTLVAALEHSMRDAAYHVHLAWLRRIGCSAIARARLELRGKNLACWCRADGACHADVLLALANGEGSGS